MDRQACSEHTDQCSVLTNGCSALKQHSQHTDRWMRNHDKWMLGTRPSQTHLSTQHSRMHAQRSVQHAQRATDSHMHVATVRMESKLPKRQHVVKAGYCSAVTQYDHACFVSMPHLAVNLSVANCCLCSSQVCSCRPLYIGLDSIDVIGRLRCKRCTC